MNPFRCALCHQATNPRSKRRRDLCDLCDAGLAPRGLDWCPKGVHRVRADAMMQSGKMCLSCKRRIGRAAYHAKAAPTRRKGRDTTRKAEMTRNWQARNPERVRAIHARYRQNKKARLWKALIG